jgi:predicted RNA-binding Zn ribbon-like protein
MIHNPDVDNADTLNAMTTPAWVPEVEDKPAPMPLLLVQAFVDTLDRDQGTDELADRVSAQAWLALAGLIPDGTAITAADLELARAVRESIRALIGRDPLTAEQLRPLNTVIGESQPPLDITPDGQVRLCAGPADALADGLVRLLLIIRDAQADGSWDRLKLCANPDCRWAFYDRSHSRRGQWCDMTTCGNRIKNRNLRARQRSAAG